MDKTSRWVLVANYTGGNVAILPVRDDGRLGPATDVAEHRELSVDPGGRETPYAHCIVPDRANRYALAADLGLDKIMIYQMDLEEGKLIPNDPPWIPVEPGAGPRHFIFHPSGRYAFSIQELNSTLTSFTYNETNGSLAPVKTISTLPEGFRGENYPADVRVHPSGRFVYGSNRGHNSIVIFAIDEQTGGLTYVGHESTQGKTPRNFAIDPTGSILLVANQETNNIVTFRIDPQTGELAATGHVTEVPTPVCLKLIRISS